MITSVRGSQPDVWMLWEEMLTLGEHKLQTQALLGLSQ